MFTACRKPLSLCWFCNKSTCSGCSWSKSFTPVDGWEAEPTTVIQYSGSKRGSKRQPIQSFHVISCPEFVEG